MDVRNVLRQSTEKQRRNTCTLPTCLRIRHVCYALVATNTALRQRATAFQFKLLQNYTARLLSVLPVWGEMDWPTLFVEQQHMEGSIITGANTEEVDG